MRDPGITELELRDSGNLNNPGIPLSAGGFLAFAGGEPTASGERVTLDTALQQMTVFACVRVISESVASLPLKLYERLDKGKRDAADQPLAYLLSIEPNDEMSAFTFWESIVGAVAATGNGYAEIQRDKGGRPVAFWPLHPSLTTPKRLSSGKLIYETTDGMTPGKLRTIQPADMLHIPLFCFDGLKGFSPIHLARQGIGLARATEKFGARLFGNGSRPGGVMSSTSDLSDEQKRLVKETWLQSQSGDKQGSTAFLPGDWKYTPLSISPEESQFLSTRQFQRAEIAALFRVPPHYVGDSTKLSNNNAEQQGLTFVTDTLRPYLCRIEAEVSRKLLPKVGRNSSRFYISFDVSERQRGDFKTTMDGYATARQWGWLSGAEIRDEQGYNPGPPELDVYWVPANMQNAARLLDTESIQDQPIDQPVLPAPAAEDRNLLSKYTIGYIRLYRDAFGRLVNRNKRDSSAISSLFTPVLRSISELAAESLGMQISADDKHTQVIVDDLLTSFEKRVSKWSEQMTDDEIESLACGEFNKAVRTIHINVSKEVAAAKAIAALTPELVNV